MFILKKIVDIIFLILGKIRQLIEGLLGFGRPLEALVLGGTFVLFILAIVDHYMSSIIESTNYTLYFVLFMAGILLINTIYAYGLTFFFDPPRNPSELAQRIMWNFAYVINVLIGSTYLELVMGDSYNLGAELVLLTALFLIILGIASWLKPGLLSSKDIAEGLKLLRENVGNSTEHIQEGNRIVRESLRIFRLELESLFRLFRVSHIVLLSILFSVISVIIYETVEIINQINLTQNLTSDVTLIIVWAVLFGVIAVLVISGLRRSDFLNVKGEMEQGLLDAELELN